MNNKLLTPEYLFESSWEVCNKVGGIYTVLSTEAFTLYQTFNDKLIFIGPDVWRDTMPDDFIEDPSLYADWNKHASLHDKLKLKIGRWDVPGKPVVILVDFQPFFAEKDKLFFEMWEHFHVDSIHAYGDYDESCIFALAVGKVIESFYRFYNLDNTPIAALFNEWMLGMGLLYTRLHVPEIATLFTTHATSIGRSIAGNNKALYAYLDGYNGDQMARELNMEAKHSVEKQAAHFADCFTTVSQITAKECKQLLEKTPDVVTPNGFEPNFIPDSHQFPIKRQEARNTLINVAEKLCGCSIKEDAFLVSTSGRYEFRNKGIDVFIESLNKLRLSNNLDRQMIAFILVPAWMFAPRADLQEAVDKNIEISTPMQTPFLTHWLHNMSDDRIMNSIEHHGFSNAVDDKLKIIFVPCYLDGKDGILNKSYYDLLIGMDATVYPSYYEPWGYTPLESIAFSIPTITTDLSGFGMWAKEHVSGDNINDGVAVVERTDSNFDEVSHKIAADILSLSKQREEDMENIRRKCHDLSLKAQWSKFIKYYDEAFDIALKEKRKNKYGI